MYTSANADERASARLSFPMTRRRGTRAEAERDEGAESLVRYESARGLSRRGGRRVIVARVFAIRVPYVKGDGESKSENARNGCLYLVRGARDPPRERICAAASYARRIKITVR